MLFIYYGILIVQYLIVINGKWVADVDSSIINEINQNPSIGYLIKFHAPWCGHCKHFESAYEEIAKEVEELSTIDDELKNIRVVRIDATVYSDITNYYDIRGFPTIKFIRGSQIFTYENERSKSAVINFLRRVNGPTLRWITSIDKFNEIRREHDVFFLLLTTTTTTDENDQIIKEYEDIVNQYISQAYFYATNESIIQQTYFSNYQTDDQSQIFAIKNEGFYLYQSNDLNNKSLEEFILKEKVASFPQVASGNIYDLILTNKIIIIYGFNEQKKKLELKSQIHDYVIKHSSTLHDTFQFAWSNDIELLNNIAVATLEEPLFFLYNHTERKYGIYPLSSIIDQNIEIKSILDNIISNYSQLIQHSGNTWRKRLVRPFLELYRTLIAMFIEAPLLSMLVIGLPASILSIVCYCICCFPNETMMDDRDIPYEKIEDDNEEEEEEEKTTIEKKDD